MNAVQDWLTVTASGVAVDASAVYWSSYAGIGRSSLDGSVKTASFISVPEPKWTAGEELANEGSGTAEVYLDAAALYTRIVFSGHGTDEEPSGMLEKFARAPVAGGAADRFWLARESPPEEGSPLASNQGYSGIACVVGGFIYRAQDHGSGSYIARAPAHPARVLESEIDFSWLETPDGVRGMCSDGTYLYWSDYEEAIGRCPLGNPAGAQPKWLQLGSGVAGSPQPRHLAVSEGFLYWGDHDGEQIGRKALTGAKAGVTPTFCKVTGQPGQIAADKEYVYWVNESTGHIGRSDFTPEATLAGAAARTLSITDSGPVAAAILGLTPAQVTQAQLDGSTGEAGESVTAPTMAARVLTLTDAGHDPTLVAPLLNITPADVLSVFEEGAEPTAGAYTTAQRTLTLTDRGYDLQRIAVILDITPAEAEEILLAGSGAPSEEVPEEELPGEQLWIPDALSAFSEGIAVDDTYIYWSDYSTGKIARANIDGSGVDLTFIDAGPEPIGVAVTASHIYWGGAGSKTLGRALIDGTEADPEWLVPDPFQLAVNATHLYFVGKASLGRVALDGTGEEDSWASPVLNPNAVALDDTYAYVLCRYRIDRVKLDDATIEAEWVPRTGQYGGGITLTGGHLYWTNTEDATIGRVGVDGTGLNESFCPTAGEAYAMASDADHIYWADESTHAIARLAV